MDLSPASIIALSSVLSGSIGLVCVRIFCACRAKKDIVASITCSGNTLVLQHDGDGDGKITNPETFAFTADKHGVHDAKGAGAVAPQPTETAAPRDG